LQFPNGSSSLLHKYSVLTDKWRQLAGRDDEIAAAGAATDGDGH